MKNKGVVPQIKDSEGSGVLHQNMLLKNILKYIIDAKLFIKQL